MLTAVAMVPYFRWVSETRAIITRIKRDLRTNLRCLKYHLRRISHQRRPNASHEAQVVVQAALLTAHLITVPVEAEPRAQIRAPSKTLERFQRNNRSRNHIISCIQPLPLPRLTRYRTRKRPLRRRSSLLLKSWAPIRWKSVQKLLKSRPLFAPWSQIPSLTPRRHLLFHQDCHLGAFLLLSKCKTRK